MSTFPVQSHCGFQNGQNSKLIQKYLKTNLPVEVFCKNEKMFLNTYKIIVISQLISQCEFYVMITPDLYEIGVMPLSLRGHKEKFEKSY